jgi:A/G-specific adenine glycosylase
MLQQTRLQVVEPAYRRFMRAFPTLRRLARATEDDVLAEWSGLGYYSRARSLHRAAQVLIDSGERAFPRDLESALALPGIGEYTAAAVLSIAYGAPLAAVDGNVARVLSRLARLGSEADVKGLASEILDRKRPGDWNQALMELGQTVCLPRAPHCLDCPIGADCRTRSIGDVERFPAAAKRRAPERVRLELTFLADSDGRLLLERGVFPYLRHLWLPPIRVAHAGARRERAAFRHTIQHRIFEVGVKTKLLPTAVLERRARRISVGVEAALFSRVDLSRIGRSALLSKALRAAPPELVRPDAAR